MSVQKAEMAEAQNAQTPAPQKLGLLFFGLAALAILPPILGWSGSEGTWVKDGPAFFIASVLMMVWIFSRGNQLRYNRLLPAIGVFLALAALSTTLSINAPISVLGIDRNWSGLISFIAFALVYFLAIQVEWDDRKLKTLVTAIVVATACVSLIALIDFARHLMTAEIVRREKFTFLSPNGFAFYLMFAWPLALRMVFMPELTRTERSLFAAGAFLIFAANLTTFSRTGWLVCGALFLLAVMFTLKKRTGLTLVLAMLLVAAGGIFLMQNNFGKSTAALTNRFGTAAIHKSFGDRFEMGKTAVSLVKARPLTGFGPDTYRLAAPKYESLAQAQLGKSFRTPHNYPLYLAAGVGLPATLLLIAIFSWVIIVSLRSQDYLRRSLGLVMIGVFLSGLLLEWHAFLMLPFWMLMGAAAKSEPVERSVLWPVRSAVFAVSLGLFAWIGQITAADFSFQEAVHSPDRTIKAQRLHHALRINPYVSKYWEKYFDATLNHPFEERLEIIKAAQSFHPHDAGFKISEVILKKKKRAYRREALTLLDKLLVDQPFLVEAHYLKGADLLSQNRRVAARKEFETVIFLRPGTAIIKDKAQKVLSEMDQ